MTQLGPRLRNWLRARGEFGADAGASDSILIRKVQKGNVGRIEKPLRDLTITVDGRWLAIHIFKSRTVKPFQGDECFERSTSCKFEVPRFVVEMMLSRRMPCLFTVFDDVYNARMIKTGEEFGFLLKALPIFRR